MQVISSRRSTSHAADGRHACEAAGPLTTLDERICASCAFCGYELKELFNGGLVSSTGGFSFQKGEESMRDRSWWMLMLVVVAFLCLSNWTRGANSSTTTTKTTWEYRVVSVYESTTAPPHPNPTELNNAGMEGWELIAIRSGNHHPDARTNQVRMDYYFKR